MTAPTTQTPPPHLPLTSLDLCLFITCNILEPRLSLLLFLSVFSFLDKELQALRGENRKNMLLSVALLLLSVLFYYIFLYSDDDSTLLD